MSRVSPLRLAYGGCAGSLGSTITVKLSASVHEELDFSVPLVNGSREVHQHCPLEAVEVHPVEVTLPDVHGHHPLAVVRGGRAADGVTRARRQAVAVLEPWSFQTPFRYWCTSLPCCCYVHANGLRFWFSRKVLERSLQRRLHLHLPELGDPSLNSFAGPEPGLPPWKAHAAPSLGRFRRGVKRVLSPSLLIVRTGALLHHRSCPPTALYSSQHWVPARRPSSAEDEWEPVSAQGTGGARVVAEVRLWNSH